MLLVDVVYNTLLMMSPSLLTSNHWTSSLASSSHSSIVFCIIGLGRFEELVGPQEACNVIVQNCSFGQNKKIICTYVQ